MHSLTQAAPGNVVLINQPEQLFQDDLVYRLHIGADGQYRQTPGRLFVDDLMLVLDIRALSCDELPTFNDLLDPRQPGLFDKTTGTRRPLGTHVCILVLAQLDQLQHGARDPKSPGADFWRRVNRPGNQWDLPHQPTESDALLPDYPDTAVNAENRVIINCHLHASWRRLLFGGPGVDSRGRISHLPGQLAHLHDGQQVILKGGDWQDLAFEQAIRQLVKHRRYRSNGQQQRLAENITFYRMPVPDDELSKLLRATIPVTGNTGPSHILINQANIAQWLNPLGISPEGAAVHNNILTEQIRAGATLSVTSPLSEALWFQLLGAVNTITDSTGHSPSGLGAISEGQPQSLRAELAKTGFTGPHPTIKMATFEQEAQASAWLDSWHEPPLVIQISPLTTFNQLFDKLHIVSEQKAQFARQGTGLQAALQQGKPVVLRGLDNNPALQQALEPLFCTQPLPVNGTLITYPNADLTVLWPAAAKSISPLLSDARAIPCPELDIWAYSAAQHGLTRAQLPEQAIKKLYEAADTIPGHLCQALPALNPEQLGNLILAARRAQKHDNSLILAAHHWRRAIDSILTHTTRSHAAARDYLKVICQQLLPDTDDWVDPARLQQLPGNRLNRQFVIRHLWSVARCFGPGILGKCGLYLLPFSPPDLLASQTLNALCTLIVAYSAPAQQQAIARQLEVAEPGPANHYPNLSIRSSAHIRRLQDALAGGWQINALYNHTKAIETLAADCFAIARRQADDALALIRERLTETLTWRGSTEPPLQTLAEDLYHGRSNQSDYLARRLSRLHQRMADAPIIFLQGETGTGKSYFAATVARTCGPAFIVSLGPCDSEQTLAQQWCWQENGNDRGMKEENRTLMTWATTNANDKDDYVTLILDEGNLAVTGLLSALTGLWEPAPCIYVHGHPVMVSNKHRVIITGNPNSYTDRQTEPALNAKIPCVYYPRLKEEFLQEHVIKPALEKLVPSNQGSVSNAILALWQQYPKLLPDRLFTPRDLQDIGARAGWYLTCSGASQPTPEQLHAVILQCFRDLLNPQISATDRTDALASWFSVSYPLDFALVRQTHDRILAPACEAFITLSKDINPDFDTSPDAVIDLVHQLSQDLHCCQQSFHHHRPHGGRQATLIEGPPGRGKDVTLQLLLQSIEQQVMDRRESMPRVYRLNACDCSWDTLRNMIKQARTYGGIVVIAEMNLIDSRYLEGELNDILAGAAHPGFYLFATINPSHFGGRKPLSPALTDRFRRLPIRAYNLGELQAIAGKALPDNRQTEAAILARWHCRLRRHLHDNNLPLFPTSLDLQTVAKAINSGGDFRPPTLEQRFNKHYRLYLLAGATTLDKLPGLPVETTPGTIDRPLCDWLHRVLAQGPWLIKRHGCNQLLATQQTILLKSSLDTPEAQQTIITMLATAQWLAANLPLAPKPSDPELTQAFYRLWQRRWFEQHFQHTGITPDTLFPITTAWRQLLANAKPQYLEQITRLVNDFGQSSSQHWLLFNKNLKQSLPAHLRSPADSNSAVAYIPEVTGPLSGLSDTYPWPTALLKTAGILVVSAISTFAYTTEVTSPVSGLSDTYPWPTALLRTAGTLLAPAILTWQLAQAVAGSISPRRSTGWIDRETDYEKNTVKQLSLTKHFNSDQDPRLYRIECKDLRVLPDGDIKLCNFQPMEVAVDMAAKVPGRQQTEGRISLIPVDGVCLLPGLIPDEDIVEMHTTPPVEFRLSLDRYTGLYQVRLPAGNQSITIIFTVQARESRRQNFSQPLQPDIHCSQPMKSAIDTLFDHMDEYPQQQKEQLLAIKEAMTTEQRIEAIVHYCRAFSGHTKPAAHQPLFLYLLQQRQGSCRHRVLVFVGLCRYFGIPSRIIFSKHHAFVEFSLNQSWQSRDLGGAPGSVQLTLPQFSTSGQRAALTQPKAGQSLATNQPHRQSGLAAQASILFHVFNHASSEEQSLLARAMKVDTDTLRQHAQKGTPLAANLKIASVITYLWKDASLSGLSLGSALLNAKGVLDDDDKDLIGKPFQLEPRPLTSTLIKLLSTDVDTDRLIQLLTEIYTTVIVNGRVHPIIWQRALSEPLIFADYDKPATAILARKALESGWIGLKHISPDSDEGCGFVGAGLLFQLLTEFGKHEEIKTLSDDYLRRWYRHFLKPRCAISDWQNREKKTIISHSLSGHSPRLESWLSVSSLNQAWSDEPEGIADIGRLLAREPAYPRTTSGQNHRRTVIIINTLDSTEIEHVANNLMLKKVASELKLRSAQNAVENHNAITRSTTRLSAAMRSVDDGLAFNLTQIVDAELKNAIYQSDALLTTAIRLLKEQFCQYLFEKTTACGNQLHYCWFGGFVENCNIGFGSHQPSSPQELLAMFTHIEDDRLIHLDLNHTLINEALNTSNALILDDSELTTIFDEYLTSVDLNLICNHWP